ncbi:Flp pilus assembly protein TadB [Mycobacterium tuberculosis]|nr:Flp pilus assembly protein TadB [Mycobacterium tuberculosis]
MLIYLEQGLIKGKFIDLVISKKYRQKFNALELGYTYERYLAKTILLSLLVIPLLPLLVVVTEEPLFYLGIPLLGGVFFMLGLREIEVKYRKRQRLLVRDLPNLIDKMISGLEVGTPLVEVFRVVSLQSSPLLSKYLKEMITNSNRMSISAALSIFASRINIPVIYDFVRTAQIINDKGFYEAKSELVRIKERLRGLRKQSLQELTSRNPEKMNLYYILVIAHAFVFIFMGFINVFGLIGQL